METTPFRESCQSCNELQSKLDHQTSESERLQARIREHTCWSLGRETEGSTILDFISAISILASVGTGAAAANGALRWGVSAVFFVAAIILRVWGLSFRIL